jgi:hypothetical protein
MSVRKRRGLPFEPSAVSPAKIQNFSTMQQKTEKIYQWPKDWAQVRKDFIAVFHLSIVDFYDPFLSYAMQKFMLNLVKLDDKLHRIHGDYEERGMSMKDIIEKNYGQAGLNLIEQLL